MTTATVTELLTDSERAEFVMLEARIKRGLSIFYEIGAALLTIRDKRLYRADYHNFEAYCVERWDMGRRYANMLIAASDVVENLKGTVVPLPAHETHVRPLVSLAPIEQRIVYEVAQQTAPNGNVTEAHIKSVVAVFKEAVITGAVDNGEGESIHVSQLAKALITEQTYERMQRQSSYIETATQNASLKRHKAQGTFFALVDGELHVNLETGDLKGIQALIGKKVVITIREASE